MAESSRVAPGTVFVTGATGVVGRLAVPELVQRGWQVTAVGRSSEKRAALSAMGARAVELDIFDGAAARRALGGHDAVINLATHMPSSVFRTMFRRSWRENDRVRREGSATLVDAALAVGVRRFIQESFAPVYEDGGDQWIDEHWPMRPTSYNRTVLDAEEAAARFTMGGGAGVVLRFASFYGADAFLREMVKVARRGWMPIPGSPDSYWSSLAHADAATAVVAALGVPPGVYTIADDEPLTRREWADVLASAIGAKRLRFMPTWMFALSATMRLLSRSQRMSNAAFKWATGWSPTWTSARVGLPVAVRAL
jgi:nucleoside-diphosphate-sugar epimerase